MQHFCKHFGNVQILRNALTIVKAFFWVDLSYFLDFMETAVIVVSVVAEFESMIKIWVAPFLDDFSLIFV